MNFVLEFVFGMVGFVVFVWGASKIADNIAESYTKPLEAILEELKGIHEELRRLSREELRRLSR